MQATTVRALAFTLVLLIAVPLFAQEQASTFQIASDDLSSTVKPGTNLFAAAAPAAKPQGSSANSGRSSRKWEAEFHVGGTFNTDLHGTLSSYPTATSLNPDFLGGTETFYPTYFFGPGNNNFNEISGNNAFFGNLGTITSLDPVLQTNILERNSSFAVGGRISRDLHPRWTLEASVDYNFGELQMKSSALAAAAASAASWATAFGNFAAIVGGTNSMTATTTSQNDGMRQFSYTGALLFNMRTQGKFIPYFVFGGGGVSNMGDKPTLNVNGDATFDPGIIGPVRERDNVSVRFDIPTTQGVALFGGGFKYYVTDRWGFRVDVRDHVIFGNYHTLVSANPNVADAGCGNSYFETDAFGNHLFFSCDQSFIRSNLNTTPINDFRSFSIDGPHHQLKVDFGILLRW